MNTISHLLAQHPYLDGLVLLYVLSAAVSALPQPGTQQPIGQLIYQWLFTFAHTLLNNVEQAARAKYPNISFTGQPQIDPKIGGEKKV